MDSSEDSDGRRRKESGFNYDSPPTGQPFIRQPDVEGTVHESEKELDDVNPPEEDPSLQVEGTEAPAAEEFPPPPESMAMEGNEEENEDRKPHGSEEPHENEPEELAEGDTSPLVNEEPDPPNKVIAANNDQDDDDIELTEVTGPPSPQPAQENPSNRPGQSLNYEPSVRARYVQRHVTYVNEDKEVYTKFCWMCVCLILAACIVGFVLAVALVPNLDPGLSSAVVTDGPAGDVVLAEVMVTLDLNFTDYLYNISSRQYKELEADYLQWLQQIFSRTSFSEEVFGAFVNGFRPGSVIVHSSVFFNLINNTLASLESNLTNELNSVIDEEETFSTLPVQGIAVGEVIRYSDDAKRPIEIFLTTPRPQTNQTTVTSSTQRINTTQMVGASNSTVTPSSSLSLGTSATSSPTTYLDGEIASTEMQALSTATRGTNSTMADASNSNVTTPVTNT